MILDFEDECSGKNHHEVIRCRDIGRAFSLLRKFLPLPRSFSAARTIVRGIRARGNQLIHRTAVREHPPPLTLVLLRSYSPRSPHRPRRSAFTSWAYSLFLSSPSIYLSLSLLCACTRILVEIESREASLAWRSISFYMRHRVPGYVRRCHDEITAAYLIWFLALSLSLFRSFCLSIEAVLR